MQKLVAIAFVLTVIVFVGPAKAYAQGNTQSNQMACQDDAFRLCGHAIPDERKVKACLIANKRKLSRGCRRLIR